LSTGGADHRVGALIRISARDLDEIAEHAAGRLPFTVVVDTREAQLAPSQPALVVSDDDIVEFVGLLTRSRWAGTNRRSARLSEIDIVGPIPLGEIAKVMPAATRCYARPIVPASLYPPATWRDVFAAIRQLDDYAGSRLDRLDRMSRGPEPLVSFVQAEERDAVLLSLEIAGLPRALAARSTTARAHFLTGSEPDEDLAGVQILEDQMLLHDTQLFPGWDRDRDGDLAGIGYAFHDRAGERRLTVMNVNRSAIETTTGVDLIYYRHEPDAFVLVQYKRLVEEPTGWLYRPSRDANFAAERQRMVDLRSALGSPGPGFSGPHEYRLSGEPFYFKLCSSRLIDQSSDQLIRGMYIPLEYFDLLEAGGGLAGPRGGVAIGWDNAGRWLDNTTFARLVGDAWIGTYGQASRNLAEVIRGGLRLGRAVIVAIEEGGPRQTAARR
jgi:hypothetical protein